MVFRTMVLFFFYFTIVNVYAYEPDFELRGTFLIESYKAGSKSSRLELWDVNLLRGLVDNKARFTDFSLVMMSLIPNRMDDTYSIRDIRTHKYREGERFNTLHFSNNSFYLKFGIGLNRNLNVKISFNKDGTLKNITGSFFRETKPENVTTFKLAKDLKQVRIIQDNNYILKNYLFEGRK